MPQNMSQSNIGQLGAWRAAGNTGDLPVGWNGGSSSGGANATYDSNFQALSDQVSRRVDDLIAQANGDYDFVAKQIEQEYKDLTGTQGEAEKKQFLLSVANSLEEKVGRVQYDYQTGKYRTEQDIAQIGSNKDTLLRRLDEDQKTSIKDLTKEARVGKIALREDLNARGLINGSMTEGLVGKNINEYDADVADRFSALEREFSRGTEDINTAAATDIQSKTRSLEDLTTGTRRGVVDANTAYTTGLEEAKRKKEALIKQLELEKISGIQSAKDNALKVTTKSLGF